MLTIDKVTRRFGAKAAVSDVSLDIAEGAFIGVIGRSGAGKSTLLRMINRLQDPSEGRILFSGRDVTGLHGAELRAWRQSCAMIFQQFNLVGRLDVLTNVLMGRLNHVSQARALLKLWTAEDKAIALSALEQFDIGSLASQRAESLSGGQQQRVAIARALVYNPPVILLDEPLSNLDAKLREEARAFLRELIVRLGLSALMVTHDQSEAMAMSDRILLLNNGVIEQQGTPEEMYGAPQTLFTAEFMGSNNRVNGKIAEVRDGMARLVDEAGGWSLWGVARGDLKPGASAHGVIRLEQVRVGVDNADNTIRLPLATRMYLGDRWECLFRATGDAGTGLRAYASSAPSEGQYALTFPREQFWLYAA